MKLVVLKFGGTSVADVPQIKKIALKVKEEVNQGNKVIVVVSAMSGVTNDLIDLVKTTSETPSYSEYDVILSTGEQVTSALLATALNNLNIKARSWLGWQVPIISDNSYGKAVIEEIKTDNVLEFLKKNQVAIISGFQGVSKENRITTLGRGGSDTSAVAIAAAFSAERCDIYTDVDGVYTTDPNVYKKAKKIDKICFEEMLELSSLGAKVLQIRSVEFASKYQMPLRVLSSFNKSGGTLITKEDNSLESAVISGITCSNDDSKIILRNVPDTPGIAAKILSPISEAGIDVDVIVQNVGSDKSTDFTFTVKNDLSEKAAKILKDLTEGFGGGEVELVKDVSKVSVVGVGMKSHAGVAAQMFGALANKKINIDMISTSEIKISVVVAKDKAEEAVIALHDEFELDK